VNVRRTEDYHHTPAQVNGYIEQAIVLVNATGLGEGARERLLPHIVNLLSGKNITYEQVVPAGMDLPQNARH